MECVTIRPLAERIDVLHRCSYASSLTTTGYCLGIHQIDIRQTEHREIGIGESSIATRLTITPQIGIFIYRPTFGSERTGHGSRDVDTPVLVVKDTALVQNLIGFGVGIILIVEPLHQFRCTPETIPSTGNACRHIGEVATASRTENDCCHPVALRRIPIEDDRKDDFLIGTSIFPIISHKKFCIIICQLITGSYHPITGSNTIGVTLRPRIDFRIEVHPCQQGIDHGLVCPTVFTLTGSRKHFLNTLQFTFNPGEQLFSGKLTGIDGIILFRNERRNTEHIQ